MAQKLIVEGNDGIALAILCKKCGLAAPRGYSNEHKFKHEFISNGGGFDGAIDALKQAINQSDNTNIGLIVDANEKGKDARWNTIRAILAEKFSEAVLAEADRQPGAKVIQDESLPKVGVWIMPDNASNGYLEHFLGSIVPENDSLWTHAEKVLAGLSNEPFNELTPIKHQKALLHTWLAWKKEPGKPFGQAIVANYFNINAPSVEPFLQWFKDTYDLDPEAL